MRSIISIVGKSSSGKTTLLEKLIAELKSRGYKVAIVKHSHHKDDLDTAEKDTWRFTKAGTELSAINSLDHLAIYRQAWTISSTRRTFPISYSGTTISC